MNKYLYLLLIFFQGAVLAQSGGNTAVIDISGSGNILEIRQENLGNTQGHYTVIDLTGTNNNLLIQQQGIGNMILELTVQGNNHLVNSNQKDSGAHQATVTLINSGGAVNLNLLQQGSTPAVINFYQSCANPTGCSATVNQNSP